MKLFTDTALPAVVGLGIGILCAIRDYTVLQTLGFVTIFYVLWKATILWSHNRHG